MPLPNNALPLSPSPVHSCARRLFTLPFLYSALQDFTPPCLRCALHCITLPCHCFSGRIEATHFDAQPARVTAILRLHYAKHLPAAPFQRYASLHFSIALLRYASPREASAVLLVPKQNSAYPMQFLTVRRSTSPLLCLAVLRFSFATQNSTKLCRCCAFQLSAVPLLC